LVLKSDHLESEGRKLHVVLALLYSVVCYLSGLLYCVIVAPEHLLMVIICGPVIISGVVAFLITVESIWWAMGARRRAERRLEATRLDIAEREARRLAARDERRRAA
jgi:hypothetical protein